VLKFPTLVTLKKRGDFLRVSHTELRYVTPAFLLVGRRQDPALNITSCRVGFTVTRKTGNAVARNRIKRRFRAALRALWPDIHTLPLDLVLIARKEALSIEFDQLVIELERGCKKFHKRIGG
jgi:ribonuclease P protein component